MRTEEQLRELLKIYKMSMVDYEPDVSIQNVAHLAVKYDKFQAKYDGWFTLVDFWGGIMRVMTSGGDIRLTRDVDFKGSALLLCEWMYGTNWSQAPGRKGKFVVFDAIDLPRLMAFKECLDCREKGISEFLDEYGHLLGYEFVQVITWNIPDLIEIWDRWVIGLGFEGIVLKNSMDKLGPGMHLGRMKKEVDMDYVIMGFNEGKNRLTGTLGSIIGGLYKNGELVPVCTVGGGFDDALRDWVWNNRGQLRGRVMKVYGKVRFSTGALRHPAIDAKRGWLREDKSKEECVFHSEWGN